MTQPGGHDPRRTAHDSPAMRRLLAEPDLERSFFYTIGHDHA